MNKERLRLLAEFLKTVNPVKFDLCTWRSPSPGDWTISEVLRSDKSLLDNDCGTTGCAIGWACVIPEFIEAGLVYKEEGPTFDGYVSWEATEAFFDIPPKVATLLFSSNEYPFNTSAHVVADRIETVISI
jgi:hypothetical protein